MEKRREIIVIASIKSIKFIWIHSTFLLYISYHRVHNFICFLSFFESVISLFVLEKFVSFLDPESG